jgi:hypothetical protein
MNSMRMITLSYEYQIKKKEEEEVLSNYKKN